MVTGARSVVFVEVWSLEAGRGRCWCQESVSIRVRLGRTHLLYLQYFFNIIICVPITNKKETIQTSTTLIQNI